MTAIGNVSTPKLTNLAGAAQEKPNVGSYFGLDAKTATNRATNNGVPNRIINVDGEPQMVDRAFIEGRLNFSVTGGKVSNVSVESAKSADHRSEFVGMNADNAIFIAEKRGLDSRIAVLDGVAQPVDRMHKEGRLNFFVDAGRVSDLYVE